jgi:hypothetical protein
VRAGANTGANQDASTSESPVDPETGLARGALVAGVQTAGVGDWVWSNALALLDPSAEFGVVGGRAAPVRDADEAERQPQPVSLQMIVAPGEARVSRLLPIRAQNLAGGTLLVQGSRYDEAGLKLSVWPNTRANGVQRGAFSISLGEAAPVRLTFCSGAYAITPGSRHRVTLSLTNPTAVVAPSTPNSRGAVAATVNIAPRVQTQIITADARGRFTVEATGSALVIEVARVS